MNQPSFLNYIISNHIPILCRLEPKRWLNPRSVTHQLDSTDPAEGRGADGSARRVKRVVGVPGVAMKGGKTRSGWSSTNTTNTTRIEMSSRVMPKDIGKLSRFPFSKPQPDSGQSHHVPQSEMRQERLVGAEWPSSRNPSTKNGPNYRRPLICLQEISKGTWAKEWCLNKNTGDQLQLPA